MANEPILDQIPTTAVSLPLRADTASWVFATAKKLEEISKLSYNWDSYGGRPISQGARRMAFDALKSLSKRQLPVPAVVLGSAGTVHLEWRYHNKKLEIGFDDRNAIEFLKVDSNGEWQEEENVNSNIQEKLELLANWLEM